MKAIVAIGGGKSLKATTSIDKRIVELSHKENPNLLFLPTASGDDSSYFDNVKAHFSQWGCRSDVLYLLKENPSSQMIQEKILGADIIYVGGGNTLRMMKRWRKLGVDQFLRQAYERGTVMSGLSAGAICWFRYGNSDSRKFNNPEADLIKVSGLNFVNALYCPHYDTEEDRKGDLKAMMKKNPGLVALAVDDCCAIEIVDDRFKIIASNPNANAYKVYWKKGAYSVKNISKDDAYQSLSELLIK